EAHAPLSSFVGCSIVQPVAFLVVSVIGPPGARAPRPVRNTQPAWPRGRASHEAAPRPARPRRSPPRGRGSDGPLGTAARRTPGPTPSPTATAAFPPA